MALPINIQDLVHGRTVESERLEFKQGWNPEVVMHSMCAFANDLNNWGGGYIIIGVAENAGQPILPPVGLQQNQLDSIQGEIVQLGNNISPTYFPITQPYVLDGKHILVLWCPAGDNRPYLAPSTLGQGAQRHYYIRVGSRSIQANGDILRQLQELTARVPFDDRINNRASLQDLDLALIQAHLQEIKSDLFEESKVLSFPDLCRAMLIAKGADEDIRPVNVGLLFFSKAPESFFPRTWIELVWHKDKSGTSFTEHYFKGPLQKQLRDALSYIQTNIVSEKVVKFPDKAESDRFYNYPYKAIEEALSNAVYHKSYELGSPIEVQIRPDRIDILSYPAAMPPVNKHILSTSRLIIARQYRNRRIGDFLKELHLTEGRGTGFPAMYDAMSNNGSPAPIFDSDDSTYVLVTIPIHSAFNVQASTESDQASIQAEQLFFNTLEDVLAFCNQASAQASAQVSAQAQDIVRHYLHGKVWDILSIGETWLSREQILEKIGLSNHHKNKVKYIDPLVEFGLVEMKFPDHRTHPDQLYRKTESGKRLLTLLNHL